MVVKVVEEGHEHILEDQKMMRSGSLESHTFPSYSFFRRTSGAM
jgi:hypothetical protein